MLTQMLTLTANSSAVFVLTQMFMLTDCDGSAAFMWTRMLMLTERTSCFMLTPMLTDIASCFFCFLFCLLTQRLMLITRASCFDVDSDVHVDCDSSAVFILT